MSDGQKSIRTAFSEGGIARAFSSRNYKIFWAGHTSFILGVWINNIALGWLMWELTTSKTWLGLIAAASMMPMMFFGPIAGATADRYGHRQQVQISTVLGGVLTIVIATFTLMGQMTPGLLIGLAAIGGISRAFNVPARSAMLHSIVEPDTLSAAIAVNGASYHGGRFVGPALGGMIITFAGVSAALFVYAFLAFTAAVTLQFLVIRDDGSGPRKRQSLARELAAGFGYTYGHRGIRNLMVLTALIALFLEPYFQMLAAFATQVFDRSVDGFSMMASAAGLGAMFGGLWLAQRGRTEGLVRILIFAILLGIGSLILLAMTNTFWIALVILFFTGMSLVAGPICIQTLVQTSVANEFRARVIALSGVIVISGPAIGAVVVGWIGDQVGIQTPVLGSALIALLIWLLMSRTTNAAASQLEKA